MKRPFSTSRGFTVPELLISISILSILLLIASSFLLKGLQLINLNTTRTSIMRDARTNSELMTRMLRQARSQSILIGRISASEPRCSLIRFGHINGNPYQLFQERRNLFLQEGTWPATTGGTITWNAKKLLSTNLDALFFFFPRTDDESTLIVSAAFGNRADARTRKTMQMTTESIRIMN